jgi:hypothetical protein
VLYVRLSFLIKDIFKGERERKKKKTKIIKARLHFIIVDITTNLPSE